MLLILEMANNHGGNPLIGAEIIDRFRDVSDKFPQFTYAFKFQYRDLPTFIHPSADPNHKYVKRFRSTNLSDDDRLVLKEWAAKTGFLTACTPFDEPSVDLVEKHGYDILKIASCSFTDWPLWDRVLRTNLPIVASTAGASAADIDTVVRSCRGRDLTLMHCVAQYPTPGPEANINRVGWLKARYPHLKIGLSSHEYYASTRLPVALALAQKAEVFEKHVCIAPRPNDYSVTPQEFAHWLYRVSDTILVLGREEFVFRECELETLRSLQRREIEGRMWWKP